MPNISRNYFIFATRDRQKSASLVLKFLEIWPIIITKLVKILRQNWHCRTDGTFLCETVFVSRRSDLRLPRYRRWKRRIIFNISLRLSLSRARPSRSHRVHWPIASPRHVRWSVQTPSQQFFYYLLSRVRISRKKCRSQRWLAHSSSPHVRVIAKRLSGPVSRQPFEISKWNKMRFKGPVLHYVPSGFRFDVLRQETLIFHYELKLGLIMSWIWGRLSGIVFFFLGKIGKVSRVYASLGYLKFQKLM